MALYNKISKLGGAANGITYAETLDVNGEPISRILSIDFMKAKPLGNFGEGTPTAIGESIEAGEDPYFERMLIQLLLIYQSIQVFENNAALTIALDRNNPGELWASGMEAYQKNGRNLYGEVRQTMVRVMKESGINVPNPASLT